MAPADLPPHPEPVQHRFESQRLRLAYWEWGSAEAPPLVLLHGKRDHARSLDRLAAAFCGDYRVIAPDLRGHGDSDWAVGGYYGMSEHIADLLALIEVIAGRPTSSGTRSARGSRSTRRAPSRSASTPSSRSRRR